MWDKGLLLVSFFFFSDKTIEAEKEIDYLLILVPSMRHITWFFKELSIIKSFVYMSIQRHEVGLLRRLIGPGLEMQLYTAVSMPLYINI